MVDDGRLKAAPYRSDAAPDDVVPCPLCAVPHRRVSVTCDSCGQPIHAPVDFAALEAEAVRCRRDIGLASGLVVWMVAANVLVFRMAALIVVVGPFAWLVRSSVRYRAIRKRLAVRAKNLA